MVIQDYFGQQYQKFYTAFYQSKMVLCISFHLLARTNFAMQDVRCHASSINYLQNFFKCFTLFILIAPGHKSCMNHSFKIIIIIINAIIIKAYSIVYIITNKCSNIRVYIIKVFITRA